MPIIHQSPAFLTTDVFSSMQPGYATANHQENTMDHYRPQDWFQSMSSLQTTLPFYVDRQIETNQKTISRTL